MLLAHIDVLLERFRALGCVVTGDELSPATCKPTEVIPPFRKCVCQAIQTFSVLVPPFDLGVKLGYALRKSEIKVRIDESVVDLPAKPKEVLDLFGSLCDTPMRISRGTSRKREGSKPVRSCPAAPVQERKDRGRHC